MYLVTFLIIGDDGDAVHAEIDSVHGEFASIHRHTRRIDGRLQASTPRYNSPMVLLMAKVTRSACGREAMYRNRRPIRQRVSDDIDWMLALPDPLALRYHRSMTQFEEKGDMAHQSTAERIG